MTDTSTPVQEQPTAPAVAETTAAPQAPKTPFSKKAKGFLKNIFGRAVMGVAYGYFRVANRVEVRGLEHFKGLEGKPLVIVSNHVSLKDGVLMGATLPLKASFAIFDGMYARLRNSVWRPLLPFMDLYPLSEENPHALKDLTRLAQSGKPVMIFPEGRLASVPSIMQVMPGPASVADNADALIVPAYIDGMQFMKFGAHRMRNHPKKLFPKLRLTFLEPRKLDIPAELTGKARRKEQKKQLDKIMRETMVNAIDPKQTLFAALNEAAANYGFDRPVLDDPSKEGVTYGNIVAGAYALGSRLAARTAVGENVGFLLPNSIGASVSFWALQAYGRVPAMLNAKSGAGDILSCAHTSGLKTIITSRQLVEKAKLENTIAALAEKCSIVYLEDIKKEIGFFRKTKAFLQSKGFFPGPRIKRTGNDPATVIFTSGSEGQPKGVVLSSTNLLANVAQISSVLPLKPDERLFNAMPIFHSFGLCGGMIMPVLKGMNSYQFPSPLEGKTIPKAAYYHDSTIMFGTDTFLNLYARNAENDDFRGLRMAIAGAEALKEETRETYRKRFGVNVYQAYGMTEASPAVTMNVPGASKDGTVGRFLPGIAVRQDDVPGVDNGKRISIKGPNIMLGYLKHDNPGVIQPPADGWHDTGDIGAIDEDGFLTLRGRAKRFAKIGGEMVSLDAVEDIARKAAQTPKSEQAVILDQNADGDNIVLFTTDPALKREHLTAAANDLKKSVLGLPKNNGIILIDAIPRLPTGKANYVELGKIFKAKAAAQTPAATAAPTPATDTPAAPQPGA